MPSRIVYDAGWIAGSYALVACLLSGDSHDHEASRFIVHTPFAKARWDGSPDIVTLYWAGMPNPLHGDWPNLAQLQHGFGSHVVPTPLNTCPVPWH